jgi:hypothetical protein
MPAPQHNRGGSGTRPYLDQHHSPFAIRHSLSFDSRFAVFPHSRFAIRYSPSLSIRHSLFAIRHSLSFDSRFAVFHRSPLVARRSPFFTIRHSLFAIRCLSPLAVFRRCSLALRWILG